MSAGNNTTSYEVTRRVARIVLTTIKKIGSTRGATLKKIHDYIKHAYPYTPHNIVKINNTLQKALALGAVRKKNNNIIKDIVDGQGMCQAYILRTKRGRKRGKKKKKGKKRRRRRRKRGRSRAPMRRK